jgi:hypothetical protein
MNDDDLKALQEELEAKNRYLSKKAKIKCKITHNSRRERTRST